MGLISYSSCNNEIRIPIFLPSLFQKSIRLFIYIYADFDIRGIDSCRDEESNLDLFILPPPETSSILCPVFNSYSFVFKRPSFFRLSSPFPSLHRRHSFVRLTSVEPRVAFKLIRSGLDEFLDNGKVCDWE